MLGMAGQQVAFCCLHEAVSGASAAANNMHVFLCMLIIFAEFTGSQANTAMPAFRLQANAPIRIQSKLGASACGQMPVSSRVRLQITLLEW